MEEYKLGGFYWVVLAAPIGTSPPTIARFDGRRWWAAGYSTGFKPSEVEVISDRLEPPVRFEVETVPG
jgi:hypothetical protein